MKKVCISGITGQTGSYLSEKLLNDGYKVYGLIRKSSVFNTERIENIIGHPNLDNSYGDLTDGSNISNWIAKIKPDYFFNLGALSHVAVSFNEPNYVLQADAGGVINCLEAIRMHSPHTRFCQASTSELFGSSPPPQDENTPLCPQSPYGVAKLAGYWTVKNYRTGYGLFAVNSISFNHESPRRSPTFLTAKVVKAAARIKYGLQDEVILGNLKSARSWNHCKDIVDGMMLIIDQKTPDDYVIGSNKMITVQQFVEIVFTKLGMNWQDYVKTDQKHYRPNEVDQLEPNPTKIMKLGWRPKYSLDMLIDEMIENEMELARQEKLLLDNKRALSGNAHSTTHPTIEVSPNGSSRSGSNNDQY